MGKTIVAFTESEVVVAESGIRPAEPGVFVPGLSYMRAQAREGDLMFAIIDRSESEVVEELGVPLREVRSGTVKIECHGDGAGEGYVLLYASDRIIAVSTGASGDYPASGEAPDGVAEYLDADGKMVYVSLPFGSVGWLQERHGVTALLTVIPPSLELQVAEGTKREGGWTL